MKAGAEMQTVVTDLLEHWANNKPYPGSREFYAGQIRTYQSQVRNLRRCIANNKISDDLVRRLKLVIPVKLKMVQECREKLGMNNRGCKNG